VRRGRRYVRLCCAASTEDHYRLRRVRENVQICGVVLMNDVRLLLRLDDLSLLALIRLLSARALRGLRRTVLRLGVLALFRRFLLRVSRRERLAVDLHRRIRQCGELRLDHVADRLLQHVQSVVAHLTLSRKVLNKPLCQRLDIVGLPYAHLDRVVLKRDEERHHCGRVSV
jgi:hypothetical protein